MLTYPLTKNGGVSLYEQNRPPMTLLQGDVLLLCSDGLSNVMADQEMLFEVAHGVRKSDCCQRLLRIAKNRGAPDNVTVAMALV